MTITRYTLMREQSGYRVTGNLAESPKGEYVKWSDVEPLLRDASIAVFAALAHTLTPLGAADRTAVEKIQNRLIAALSESAK